MNPVADVCWECLFPISIGPIRIGSAAGAPDTPNLGSPICYCGSPIPRIGLSLGVWEPARLIDASRTPWCFPNLGGMTIDAGLARRTRSHGFASGGDGAQGSTWHVHYYVYPLLSWIGALIDLGCLEGGGLDIAWVSELDPAWRDDELSFLLNPEAALFADLPAQAACAADCAAASAGLPLDPLYWCAGCQGAMYPLTGQRGRARGRRAGLAARRATARLPPAPDPARVGHLGLGGPVRPLSDADHEEITVPLADDPAGTRHLGADRLQPHGPLHRALGVAPRAPGRGGEFWYPAMAQAQLLPPLRNFIWAVIRYLRP